MEVTEVRIRLIHDSNAEKLCAFATITLDREFVVRDMKLIDGNNGLFVAMPSRRVMSRCRKCGFKNAVRSNFCNECGSKLPESSPEELQDSRTKMHVDVAHPVTSPCRERIHKAVVDAYRDARKKQASSTSSESADGDNSPHAGDWHIFS